LSSQDTHDGGLTVIELMREHIDQLTSVGGSQLSKYRRAVDLHFSGDLGRRPVAAVKYEDIVSWLRWMQEKGLSAKTIANHHGLLSATMTTAVRREIRAANPCKGVKLPKSTRTADPTRFMTRDEWSRIMAAMDPHYVPFFQLLIGTGLRFSEGTALLASDFQLDAVTPVVRVVKAWKEDGHGGYLIGPPKTRKSIRTVSLAPSTVDAIRARVEAAGDGLVFTHPKGVPLRSSQAWKSWGPACEAAGFPKDARPRIHDIRHSHASWMVAAGLEIFALSRRLGHESITVTMDRYSHLMPDANFTGAQVAQKALEGI
jgi:integrase